MTGRLDTPVPARMARLDRDRRGYPIPVIVLRGADGTPHFAVNDTLVTLRLYRDDGCHICGQKLTRGRWLVGGPLSAFHEDGCYNDGPLHRECLLYALRVCPYLAMSSYAGRVEGKTIDDGVPRLLASTTMIAAHPALFVAIMVLKYDLVPHKGGGVYVRPHRPYRRIEYWRDGGQLDREEGEAVVRAALNQPLPERMSPRVYRHTGRRG